MAYSKNPPVVPCKKRKEEDNTQQVCKQCGAEAISISRGFTHCVDKEFEDKYGSARGPQKEGLRIGMLNANSMLRKMDLITGLIHSHQFDIFVVVENALKDADADADVTISDYKKIRFNRPGNNYKKRGGGIIIYHRECVSVEEKPEEGTVFQDRSRYYPMQYIHARVTHPWEFHLVAIYNPKKEQRKKVVEYMKTVCKRHEKDNIVMLGDLNVEPMKEIVDLGAEQIIKHRTFVTGNNSTTIDHIYTNIQIAEGVGGGGGGPGPGGGQRGEKTSSSTIVESGVIRSAISDHDVVFCTVKLPEDITLPSKCFAPDKDLINLFDGTSSNASITELMQHIGKKTKNMGPIHKSYSTTATPSDIMAEGIRELERRKIEAIKSNTTESKWKDISKAKYKYIMPSYQSKKARKKNIIQAFAECSEFLTYSSILSWSTNTGEEVTQQEVKTAIEWVIRYRANKVGRFHEVEELVKEWTSEPVLDALIEGYKIFFGPNPTICRQSAVTPTSTEKKVEFSAVKSTPTFNKFTSTKSAKKYNESDTVPPTEEKEEEESSAESIIYGVFDYLIAARTEDEVDIVKSRAETLEELHTFLKTEIEDEKCILAYFCKCSVDTNFKKYLNDITISGPFDKTKFDEYMSKRKRRVGIEESPLFQRYLAVKRAEFKASEEFKALKGCEIFASADEIVFCMTFDVGLKKIRDGKEKEDRKKWLESLKQRFKSITEFKLFVSEYNVDIGAQTVVTFLGVKLDPAGIASTENMKTLKQLERMERVNKALVSEESSIIESVFTKHKV